MRAKGYNVEDGKMVSRFRNMASNERFSGLREFVLIDPSMNGNRHIRHGEYECI